MSAAVPAAAQDAAPTTDPPAKLSTCLPCHGRNGIGTAPLNPNLAGQKALYMVKQLKAFKSGERRHDQMSLIAADLTDEDMEALSEWYAALPADGGNP
ncbi:c-type cytochrome [Caenispirillum salinarum]|uniref:c-type cytochrome n=1 Tax=Caenispirillum salinarum TaxID=859058 RepID=UPI00384B34BA